MPERPTRAPSVARPNPARSNAARSNRGPVERGQADRDALRAVGNGLVGRRKLGRCGLVGPAARHRSARPGGRGPHGGDQCADRLRPQLEQRAGQGDRRGDPGARAWARAPRGSRAARRAGPRRGSRAAARPTGRPRAGRPAGRSRHARSASSMPTPQSSTVSSCPRPPRGSRRPRTVTAMSGGENRTAFSVSSASRWVRSVTDAPSTSGPSGDLERHPVEVLGLRDRRAHDVAQRDRLAPHPRGLLAGEHQEVLRVAPHPGGEVVQAEQLGQRVRVPLRLLELVDDLQLAVEHALVAAGQVHEQVGGELPAADLGVGQLVGELVLLVLLVLGDPPEQHHADAGEQHRHAVDQRPEPRVRLRRGMVEHQRRAATSSRSPWVTTVNRMFSRNGTQSW